MSRTVGVFFAATAALAAIAPASAAGSVFASVARPSIDSGSRVAGTHYGGGGVYHGNQTANPMLGLAVQPNGQVSARASLALRCHGTLWTPVYVRLHGSAQGTAITATGRTQLGRSRVTVTVTGTADGQTATGTSRVRGRGCRGYRTTFLLHTESAPAGPAAMPAPKTIFLGLTSQSAGGLRLPISISVTHTGKVWGQWDATMACRPGTFGMTNLTPLTKIRADGTFTRRERYVIRYKRGMVDHFVVRLSGAFRSDGVSGTLTAHVRTTQPGHRFRPCYSGKQTWAARR
jgi:hypothetical protein